MFHYFNSPFGGFKVSISNLYGLNLILISMNDKRKNARTQGRFSSSDKDKDKQNEQKKSPPTNKNSDKPQNESFNSQSATKKIDVKYTSESNYSFEEFTKRKPEELKFDGRKEISKTENGVSEMIYNKNFLTEDEADHLRTVLSSSTEWNEKNIVIQGVEYPQPRLVAWYGPLPYSYSGTTLEAKEMPPSILQLKHRVEDYLKMFNINVELNSVLLNLYRDEKDSVAWHSDDELSMGVCPTIASVSLGAIRKFEIRPKKHVKDLADDTMYYINLSHGSLLIMDGSMQKDWMHRVPKEYHDKSARINLTFRTVYCND
ncbi:alpha-ketoglutarate-dependent dioxygenase alkB homolog 3, partial [Caerostris darwini]